MEVWKNSALFIKNRISSIMASYDCAISTCCKIDKKKFLFNLTLHVTEILEESCMFSVCFQEQFAVKC